MDQQTNDIKLRDVFNIDFDGTLTTGDIFTDNPEKVDNIIEKVRELYVKGKVIIIWTARQWNEAPWLVSWLIKNSVPFHGIFMGKGGSDNYLDDKMISFNDFLENKNE